MSSAGFFATLVDVLLGLVAMNDDLGLSREEEDLTAFGLTFTVVLADLF